MDRIKSQLIGEHEMIEEGTHLPFPFMIELMKGVRNILKLDTDSLLTKVNHMLNQRYFQIHCDELHKPISIPSHQSIASVIKEESEASEWLIKNISYISVSISIQ